MKLNKIFIYGILLAAASLTACEDEVMIGKANNPNLSVPGEVVYVTDPDGKRLFTHIDLRDTKDIPLYVNTPKALKRDCNIAFVYDETVLAEYNAANGTSYEAVPKSMVSLTNDGITRLEAGNTISQPMTVTVTSDGSLDNDKGYAIPLRASVNNGETALTKNSSSRLIFVRDLTGLPDATKTVLKDGVEVPAVRTMMCMEVNDMNPLEVTSYTLKNSGKMYYDAVMLFAANINYNEETGRVYVNCNENVSAILANRDHYLQPLQDRGIKVYLSILGNHDRANVNNLADETARYYAQEIKNYCDVYKLDGVFYNSEYGSPISPAPEGFVNPSYTAAARLFYEVKKLQPHRDNIIYTYDFSSLPSVDGVQPGEYMDFIWTNYGGGPIDPADFPGVPKFNLGHYSWEFTQGSTYGNLSQLRNDGYGLHVHFGNRMRQSAMRNSARAFYDDDLVYDGKTYPKDWL